MIREIERKKLNELEQVDKSYKNDENDKNYEYNENDENNELNYLNEPNVLIDAIKYTSDVVMALTTKINNQDEEIDMLKNSLRNMEEKIDNLLNQYADFYTNIINIPNIKKAIEKDIEQKEDLITEHNENAFSTAHTENDQTDVYSKTNGYDTMTVGTKGFEVTSIGSTDIKKIKMAQMTQVVSKLIKKQGELDINLKKVEDLTKKTAVDVEQNEENKEKIDEDEKKKIDEQLLITRRRNKIMRRF